MARSVVVLPQPEGPSSVRCSPAPTVKLTPRTAATVAVAHDQVAHLDRAPGSRSLASRAGRRGAPPRTGSTSATTTASVWISAIAAVSSELVENHDSTIDGVITLAFGPIRRIEAPSSRTLAMNSSSHAATRPGLSSGIVTVRMR